MKKRMLSIKHAIISRLNKWLPDPTPEQTLKDDAKTVENFIQGKENRDKAIFVAQGIKNDFKHWFTVKQLVKKYNTAPEAIATQLQMLSLFKLCTSKVNSKNVALFKICLSTEDRLKVLRSRFEENTKENNQIASEIETLERK